MQLKNISPVTVVGLVLTVACFVLYISGPTFIRDISNKAYDAILRQVATDPKTDQVVIVDIDESSLAAVGQWPWPRYVVGQLAAKVLEGGASVLAFDIIFPEKDRTSPAFVSKELNESFNLNVEFKGVPDDLSDFDQFFAEVLKQGNTILACYMHPSDKAVTNVDLSVDPHYKSHIQLLTKSSKATNINDYVMQADGITVSIPQLNQAASEAFFNAVTDSDSIVRSNPLIWSLGGGERIYPSLSLEALRMFFGANSCMVDYNENGIERIRLLPGNIAIPVDQSGSLMVNYRKTRKNVKTGFASSFKSYSAIDVITDAIPAGAFSNKIVFVGTSAIGLKDIKATPISQHFSGVEVHATMIDNVLAGDVLRNPTWMPLVQSAAIVVIGLFLTMLIARGRSWLCFIICVMLIVAAMKTSAYMMKEHHLVFVPAWVLLSVAIMYPILTTIKFWQEERQRKRVRNMFSTMVSTDVLRYLENNPESFSLSGKRAEATMTFSDVAGFTTISEKLEPERLGTLLNRYLSPMTDIIMNRGGYVDKYEGDLIMAVWGVPYAMHDHAVQACLAAIEEQEKLAKIRPVLRQEFGHDIYVRMGINSGVVTAGNMGSDKKFQYTVMGDAVNQASRFEPINKDYGTSIAIGESTYEAAKDAIETRLLDLIVVKGKTKPIRVYELICRKGQLVPAKAKVVRLYEEGLALHWERKWTEAIACLDSALELDSVDGPSARLKDRIMVYKEKPPHEGWNGEFVRATKD